MAHISDNVIRILFIEEKGMKDGNIKLHETPDKINYVCIRLS